MQKMEKQKLRRRSPDFLEKGRSRKYTERVKSRRLEWNRARLRDAKEELEEFKRGP